ncbi:MAG TPA: HD domain-containing protein [Gemmatimonadales bacterium]|nr:HD domain-containing protein [Gemmatimonadales bacterium]
MTLGPRLGAAAELAVKLHGTQVKKRTETPYLAHLFSVCSLVLADGGSENEAIAALLHDALEDRPDAITPEAIQDRFNEEVLEIVVACTDVPPGWKGGEKPPWFKRKRDYIERVRHEPARFLRVALADKVDNIRSILRDHGELGDALWRRFNGGQTGSVWYYHKLLGAFRDAGLSGRRLDEYDKLVGQLLNQTGLSASDLAHYESGETDRLVSSAVMR